MINTNKRLAVLVYQAGIANVFEVQCLNMNPFGRDAKRMIQTSFDRAETYARALADSGVFAVASAHCNRAGDITDAIWDDDLSNAPFCDHMRPVYREVRDPRATEATL